MSDLDADVVVLRAPHRWRMEDARRVLVPMGGRRDQSRLRARLIASLSRSEGRILTFFGTVPPGTLPGDRARFERELRALVRSEVGVSAEVEVEEAADPVEAILHRAMQADLIILGMRRSERARRALGDLPLALARRTDVPLVLIGIRPS
jgi:nucleotide-binding universal stress UspA family protein